MQNGIKQNCFLEARVGPTVCWALYAGMSVVQLPSIIPVHPSSVVLTSAAGSPPAEVVTFKTVMCTLRSRECVSELDPASFFSHL